MSIRWLGGLSVILGLWVLPAAGEDLVWRPGQNRSRVDNSAPQGLSAVALGAPIALGRPVPVAEPAMGNSTLVPVNYVFSNPSLPPSAVRAQAAEPPPPVPPPGASPPPLTTPPAPVPPPGIVAPPPADMYNTGAVAVPPANGPSFWDKCKNMFDFRSGPFAGSGGRHCFQSDHCFDGFISPVTNPFLFEDPRALTELRPIFIYQSIPKGTYFGGGNIEFFGVQGRVAFTDWLSLVINKLGGVWTRPSSDSWADFAGNRSGFAELDIGPKVTFIRSEQSGTLGAVGLTFQIPVGSQDVFQNTGTLSLVPYLSMGQNFWRTSYGSMNVLGTLGYTFSTDNKRSEAFFTSLHLDYDIGNLHRFYPLLELNWTHYAKNGSVRDIDFEGLDLFNLGAMHVNGHDTLTLAGGFRYKFSEYVQLGTAVEFPVAGKKDLLNFRWTIDMIFRY